MLPPLHLRESVKAAIEMDAKVNVTTMWQINWSAQWTFRWDVSVLGPLGYSEPTGMRVHVYALDSKRQHKYHEELNFYGTSSNFPLFFGTYDLLFHNNDSGALQFRQEEGADDIVAFTRVISKGLKDAAPIQSVEQKTNPRSEARAPEAEPVILMPDDLFSLFDQNQEISEDLTKYEFIDGKYVIRIEGELFPSTYIYLVQIKLVNNGDRVVGSAGGAALTGTSSSVNLRNRQTSPETASVMTDVYFDSVNDMLGARFMTFGIPGCNPYDAASVAASESTHFLVLNVSYGNGTYKNIRVDVTDQLRALPLGGVITLELDVNDFPPEGGGGGGGFEPLIDEWEQETGGTTIKR